MMNMTEQDTFVRDFENRIRRLDEEFERLVRRADSAELTLRRKVAALRTEFVSKRDELQLQLKRARIASDVAREELEAGLDAAWTELSDAFNSARTEFIRLS